MNEVILFLKQGFYHITDFEGYDHMLFVLALSLNYTYKNWKALTILITAFTLGHSISLALSVFEVVTVNSELIETLIPITILITAIKHVIFPKSDTTKEAKLLYGITLLFGIIHGLGFSNFLKELFQTSLKPNNFFQTEVTETPSIALELFSFNLGLEIGQLLILTAIIAIQLVAIRFFSLKVHLYRLILGIFVSAVSLYLIIA